MFQHNLPQETDRQKVEDFAAYLWSEMRNNDVTDVGFNTYGWVKAQYASEDKVKCHNCGGIGHKRADCKKPQADKKPKLVCKFWQKDTGCAKGAECTYQHPKKQGACYVCGSMQHKSDKCTRPKAKTEKENPQPTAANAEVVVQVTAGALRVTACRGDAGEVDEEWVLLDSGATHFVRKLKRREPIPEGAHEVRLKLAVGAVRAWRLGCLVVVSSHAVVSKLVPLGRVIRHGCRLVWDAGSARLTLPGGQNMEVKVINGEPFVTRASMEKLLKLCSVEVGAKPRAQTIEIGHLDAQPETQQPRDEPVPAHGDVKGELHEHRRCGHHPKQGSCVVCAVASKRRRPHTQLNPLTAAGGELSLDLTVPHVSAYIPKDLAREPRGRYALVAAYTPFRDAERLAALDCARAKERWFKRHLPGEGKGDDDYAGDQ